MKTQLSRQQRLTEPRVPEIPGYAWLGGPDPFEPDAGWYIGNTEATRGHALMVIGLGETVCSFTLYMPSENEQTAWHRLLLDNGIPSGGLAFSTPEALVWESLARAGYREVEHIRNLPAPGRDYDALETRLQELARLRREFPGVVKRLPDWLIRDYRIEDR